MKNAVEKKLDEGKYGFVKFEGIDPSKPVSLYFTGSFNPPTPAHIMTIVNAAVELISNKRLIIAKLYVSPSQDKYVGAKNYPDIELNGSNVKRPRMEANDRGFIFQNLLDKMKQEYSQDETIVSMLNLVEISMFEANEAGFINQSASASATEVFVDHHLLVTLFQERHPDEQIIYLSGADLYSSCCKAHELHPQMIAPRDMKNHHTISSTGIMKGDTVVMSDVIKNYSFYYPMLIDILQTNNFNNIANALLKKFIQLVSEDVQYLKLVENTLPGFLHSIEKNIGKFSTYQTSRGHAKDIPYIQKPAQALLNGLECKADEDARLSTTQSGEPLPLVNNPQVVINSFDKKNKDVKFTIAAAVIDQLLNSSKVYVNTDIFPAGEYEKKMNEGKIGPQNKELQNIAVGVCCVQKVHLLCEQQINKNGQAISIPRSTDINQDDPAILLLSCPALNFSYGKSGLLSLEQRQYAIRGMYRNLFNAAQTEGQTHIVMPAAGLGAFGGEPALYFAILMTVAAEYADLKIIYHPAQFSANFNKALMQSNVNNVVEATKDIIFIANELSKRGYSVALHNPSDADVVFGVYDVGEYWKKGHYAGEEHIGSMTTAVLNSRGLNPAAYSKIVERSLQKNSEERMSLNVLEQPANNIIIIEPKKPAVQDASIVGFVQDKKAYITINFPSKEARDNWFAILQAMVKKLGFEKQDFAALLNQNELSVYLMPASDRNLMGVTRIQAHSAMQHNPNPPQFAINFGDKQILKFFVKSFSLTDKQVSEVRHNLHRTGALYFNASALPVAVTLSVLNVDYNDNYVSKFQVEKPQEKLQGDASCSIM